MIDSHHPGKIMNKNTIKKLTYLSKLSIPESDIDELSKNLDNILKLIGEIDAASTDGRLHMAHSLDFTHPLRDDVSKKNIN